MSRNLRKKNVTIWASRSARAAIKKEDNITAELIVRSSTPVLEENVLNNLLNMENTAQFMKEDDESKNGTETEEIQYKLWKQDQLPKTTQTQSR